MAISIQCGSCKNEYRVDDKLAGKKVKCKECGQPITVPAFSGIEDPNALNLDIPMPAMPSMAPKATKCPKCHNPLPSSARICLGCGFNLQTGKVEKGAAGGGGAGHIGLAEDNTYRQKKRFVRKPGNPMLEQIDELAKLVLTIVLAISVIVWFMHIAKSPAGLSGATIAPVLILLTLLAGVLSPVMSASINTVVKIMNYVPRTDTYLRVMFAVLFPFMVGMLVGFPGAHGKFDGFVTLAWLIAPAMLIYFLRGEPVEWAASVGAAAAGVGLGLLVAWVASGIITSMTGPLVAGNLPVGGPWESLVKTGGELPSETQPAVNVAANTTKPAAQPGTPNTTGPAIAAAGTGGTPATPGPAEPAVAPTTEKTVAAAPVLPDIPPPPGATGMNNGKNGQPGMPGEAEIPVQPSLEFKSPFLTNVVTGDERLKTDAVKVNEGLKGISSVIVPSANSQYMLLVRPGDGQQETVERWSINPLEKKNEFTFAKAGGKPNGYALNGDFFIALVSFPRTQLEVYNCEKKLPKTVVDMTYHPAGVTMNLLGPADPAHFAVRIDNGSMTGLEIRTNGTGLATRNMAMENPIYNDENAIAFSQVGQFVAGLNRNSKNIDVYSNYTSRIFKTIPTTNASFQFIDLAISQNNDQVAIYALVADIPTVMSFKMGNGEPVATGILPRGALQAKSHSAVPSLAPAPARSGRGPRLANMAPGMELAKGQGRQLLWCQGALSWLVNGNDLIDAITGKRYATLGFEVPVQAQLARGDEASGNQAGGTIVLFDKVGADADSVGNVSIAKLDEAKMKEANK
jgi:predicted Zn finger-like uncharacterized protein